MELKLPPLENGVLSPEDLKFFYYNVGLENNDSLMSVVNWNDVEPFAKDKGIKVSELKCADDNVGNGEIKLTTLSTKTEDFSEALLRHLRNAFSHYRIIRIGDNYNIRDYSGKILSMIGNVNAEALKEVVFHIIETKENFKNKSIKYDNYGTIG